MIILGGVPHGLRIASVSNWADNHFAYRSNKGFIMAYCSKCGEKMEEVITYTPKTHKENGREFICPVHGRDRRPTLCCVGQTNPNNRGGRDWGKIMEGT